MSDDVNNAIAGAANTKAANDARAIQRIEAELAKLGAELAPPAGWQARVFAEIARTEERPRRRWWWLALPAAGALAAAAVAVVVWRGSEAQARPLELAYEVRPAQEGAPVVRGRGTATLGETVVVTASGGESHRAVWIYRDRELVIACPGAAGCRSADGAEIATTKLDRIGTYQLLVLTSRQPIPAPTASYDQSMAVTLRSGIERRVDSLVVR